MQYYPLKNISVEELKRELEARVLEMRRDEAIFPFNSCRTASKALHREYGFIIIAGSYRGTLDPSYEEKIRTKGHGVEVGPIDIQGHNWVYDPFNKVHIDLSLQQFNRKLPAVFIAEKKDPRIAYKRSAVTSDTLLLVEWSWFLLRWCGQEWEQNYVNRMTTRRSSKVLVKYN